MGEFLLSFLVQTNKKNYRRYLHISICEVKLWKIQALAMWQNWVLRDHKHVVGLL